MTFTEAEAEQIADEYEATTRLCELCGKPLPDGSRLDRKYCSKKHQEKAKYRRRKALTDRLRLLDDPQRALDVMAASGRPKHDSKHRKGGTLDKLVDLGLAERIRLGDMSMTKAAAMINVSTAAVSRAMDAYAEDWASKVAEVQWEMTPTNAGMVPVELIEQLRTFDPDPDVPNDLRTTLFGIVRDAFWRFEHTFITIGSKQQKMIVKPFHREILDELLRAFVWGTQVLVLTPPRHGKSELILRFCCWIIIMYPNIQVLWVAANNDLAQSMTTKLKGLFQYSVALREAFLPPGRRFGDKSCVVWTTTAFTLHTRTDHTLISPTFTALGSNATVAGRNADFIGIDDLEERKTVARPELRKKSREKHSEIMERKEPHTGVVTIASRQHADDIPNHLMEQVGDDRWELLVFPAHDEECGLDPEDYDLHVECMLMPEIRTYKWLMGRKTENAALGLPGRFELRYLQVALPTEGQIFDIPLIREVALDHNRGLGAEELLNHLDTQKDGYPWMLAGLDPSSRGIQCAFEWAWHGSKMHMVDFEDTKAGGVIGATRVMKEWHDDHGLEDWVYEDNSGQIDSWKYVETFTDAVHDCGIKLMIHTTGTNKHDAESGISSMAPWYHNGRIRLPYGTPAARVKTNKLLRQLALWTTDGLSRGQAKTDIKMASWFPFPRIQRKYRQEKAGDNGAGSGVELVDDQSYPGVNTMTDVAPWDTVYPGGQ